MKQQFACQVCKKPGPFELPNTVRLPIVVERACKHCAALNSWELRPHEKKTIKLTGKGLETVLRFVSVANERYGTDLTIEEGVGLILAELSKNLDEQGR